ncbi:Potassium/sodium hyperpolarization-activated cyclic nucleotide-gated channel 1 [Temnothorax longispinosus]|uniref:Potassium/sodium hyperpolarization-activated cyclic nucleotide-gated channel 1 n=1 Tax=Temnothorax longispinosus TaxID=300112 RepID=A0A4V3S7C8_9HYME|nr:Potassium/sodium hyperpolarization-activated cyclic nucleotide-gated channel 1 [Temnothorax longispinosus]
MTIRNPNVLIKRGNLRAHVCDLPRTSGSNLPKLPPNARFYSRWKRNLQKLVLVSIRHPLTRSVFRSQTAVAFEKKRHSKSSHRWMIHPFSMLRIGKSSSPERWNIVYPTYAICIIDIFLNFITGFISPDGHEIFLDTTLIARRYVKGYFFVDLISSVPYTWFYPTLILPPGPDSNSALLILEFLPILKLIRMPTVRRNIQQINASCGIPQAQHITIWLVILTLLIFHWSSCSSDAYYISTKLDDKSNWEVYLVFMHISVSNLIGSNFVEFDSFVTILQLLESSAKPKLKYQRIMHEVKEYIHQNKLPLYLQDKLIFYYKYRYQDNFFKENIISDTLSDHLNQETLFHSNQKLLDIMILHNLPRNVLGDLTNSLKIVIYLKEDVIYKASTEGDCMYFIASGTVTLITFSGKEICHLHDGEHFGEASLIYSNQRREESVVALEVCELLRLQRRDFKRLFAVNSEFYNSLENIVQEHSRKIKKLEE